jgi:hypothetical protein
VLWTTSALVAAARTLLQSELADCHSPQCWEMVRVKSSIRTIRGRIRRDARTFSGIMTAVGNLPQDLRFTFRSLHTTNWLAALCFKVFCHHVTIVSKFLWFKCVLQYISIALRELFVVVTKTSQILLARWVHDPDCITREATYEMGRTDENCLRCRGSLLDFMLYSYLLTQPLE